MNQTFCYWLLSGSYVSYGFVYYNILFVILETITSFIWEKEYSIVFKCVKYWNAIYGTFMLRKLILHIKCFNWKVFFY